MHAPSTPRVVALCEAAAAAGTTLGEQLVRDLDPGRTLLAVCPNSEAVVRAALRAARAADAPLCFAATLNQVDCDGGYTGWTPAALAHFIAAESGRLALDVPVVLGLDHGGPWKKDTHVRDGLGEAAALAATMAAVHRALEACIDAGYGLLHLDATADPRHPAEVLVPIPALVERTLGLMRHAEVYRQTRHGAPLLYEVGIEEVGGGNAAEARFAGFLATLTDALAAEGLPHPVFAVGDVGTALDSSGFAPDRARRLVDVAARYGMRVKGHYTDDVADPSGYPLVGIGGANVGPGLSAVEYGALMTMVALARRHGYASALPEALRTAIVESGRWTKWLRDDETGMAFENLAPERQQWLLETGSRYVWTHPSVRDARQELYAHLAPHHDADAFVLWQLETAILRYYHAFNLIGYTAELHRRAAGLLG